MTRRRVALFFTADWVSLLGDQVYYITVAWLLSQRSGGAAALVQVVLYGAVSYMLALACVGILVDGACKQRLLVAIDLLRGVGVVLGAALLTTLPPEPILRALAIGLGVGRALGVVSKRAYVAHVAAPEQLMPMNQGLSLSFSASMFVGPLLGGLALHWLGGPWSVALDGASFLVSAGCFACLPVDRGGLAAPKPSLRASAEAFSGRLGEGISHLRACWWFRRLCVMDCLAGAFLGGTVAAVLPSFMNQVYGSSQRLSAALAALGLGNIVVAFAISRLRAGRPPVAPVGCPQEVRRSIRLCFTGLASAAAAFLVFDFSRGIETTCAALFLIGAGTSFYMLQNSRLVQAHVDRRRLGVVLSAQLLVSGASSFGMLLLLERAARWIEPTAVVGTLAEVLLLAIGVCALAWSTRPRADPSQGWQSAKRVAQSA